MKLKLRGGALELSSPGDWLRLAATYHLVLRPAAWLSAHIRGPYAPRLERWWARRALRALRVDLTLSGLEYLDPGAPYVVVPLHESVVDPLVLLHLPIDVRFAIRPEIQTWPTVGPYLTRSRHVPVSPEHGVASARRLLRAAAESQTCVVAFPQGTILGIETAFQSGPFWLAAKLQRPILPVVLTGTHRVWEHPFSPSAHTGTQVAMKVLRPVAPPADAASAAHVRDSLQRKMKAAALEPGMPPPRRFRPDRDGWWDGYRFAIDPAFRELHAALVARRSDPLTAPPGGLPRKSP